MTATIRISMVEIEQILRERVLKVAGVDRVTGIRAVLEHDRHDETSYYIGHDIAIELKEKP